MKTITFKKKEKKEEKKEQNKTKPKPIWHLAK